jgi:hypothetical protein
LREEGVGVFGGVYPVGHPLAPVLVHPLVTAAAGVDVQAHPLTSDKTPAPRKRHGHD